VIKYLEYLVFLGAAVQLLGIVSYIKGTLKGKTKPNKVTWLMWSIAPIIATFAAISGGVGWAVLPVFMAGFGPLLVFIVSFVNKKSYWKLEKFDYACGFLSVLALILWVVTKQPDIAILFSIASDGAAAIPTLIKAWKQPQTESVGAYATGIFSVLTSFAAIKIWNFSSLAFPIYLIIVNSLVTVFIYRPRFLKKTERELA